MQNKDTISFTRVELTCTLESGIFFMYSVVNPLLRMVMFCWFEAVLILLCTKRSYLGNLLMLSLPVRVLVFFFVLVAGTVAKFSPIYCPV